MRMSTAAMHNNAIRTMSTQQSSLSRTQEQLSTGKRILSPSDDPAASVHLMELDRATAQSEQYGKNSNVATNRLTLEEQALADAGLLLQSVREKAVQANNASVSPEDRKLLAAEIRGRMKELMDIANRKDAAGDYLFSGYATQTEPFSNGAGAVAYNGDQGSRLQQVGATQRVADSHSGDQVFMGVTQGNGTFVTDAANTNTGSGIIAGGTMTNPAAWVQGDYTLRFTAAGNGAYEIVSTAAPATVLSSGTYTEGESIAFNGANIKLTGTPANGDSFAVTQSRKESMFTALNQMVTALESSSGSPALQAQYNSDMARVLQQLDQSDQHLLQVRADVGTRLSTLENADNARADQDVELKRMTGQLRDLDYGQAISMMQQQLVGLQAAQQSYTRISQLSLFNYLS